MLSHLSGEQKNLKLLGLDISTACIGWDFFDFSGNGSLLTHGKILIAGNSLFEKMEFGRARVLDLIKGENIYAIGIEELNCFTGGDTVRQLCMMGGAVGMALFDEGLEPNWMHTSTIKGLMGAMSNSTENRLLCASEGWSKQSAGKKLMCRRVNDKFGTNFSWHSDKQKSQDDTADAVAVGHALAHEINKGQF